MLPLFRVWKTKKARESVAEPTTVSKTAQYIASKVLACQMLFVKKMTLIDQKANVRQKKIALIVFFCFMGTVYLSNLFSGWRHSWGSFPFDQQKVNLPTNVTLPDSLDPAKQKLEKLMQSNYDSAFNKR
jgi:hypothetical protein